MPERSGKTDTPIPSASGPMWASAPTKIFRLPESIWKQNNSMRGKFTNSRGVNNPPEHFVNNQVLTVGIGPYKKQRAFSALGAMPTKSTFVFSVGGDALIAPWGASPERSGKTDMAVPLAAGRCGHRPLQKITCVFSVGGVTHKNNVRLQRRGRCPHRPVGCVHRAVRENGHAHTVSIRADVHRPLQKFNYCLLVM